MFRKASTLFFIIAFLIIFGLGIWIGRIQVVCKICPPEEVDFSLFWEAWGKIKEKFVRPEDFSTEEMIYGAISGMAESLNDPYTVFFDPKEAKEFLEDVSGRFEGIGIEIGIKDGQLRVIAPLEGTPAEKAGIIAGDKIIKINDVLSGDLTIEEAVSLIRGQKGTEVSLMVIREGWDMPKEFKIKRAIIEIPSLKWELFNSEGQKDDKGEIAYLKIYHFSEKADSDFSKAALEILKSPVKKIILDLRNNPGGYLEIATNIAGWFLEKEQVVVIEDFNKKQEQIIYKAEGNSKLLGYPLVILINQGSASAAEILASALRDNRGVKIIGETSFGKGSVQELESLRGGSSLKITVADWLTPKGDRITNVGLEPDIKVEMTEKDYSEEKDPQLEKALEIIKGIR